jgi:hypothetical protein
LRIDHGSDLAVSRGWCGLELTQLSSTNATVTLTSTLACQIFAIEQSIASTRVKQFSADNLVALSRAFRVPLGWWFIPPKGGALHTPDHDHYSVEFSELVDVVLGTPETLPAWAEALNRWEAERPTGQGGIPSVSARVSELAELQARSLVRELFGDLGNARDALRGLADLLDQLDHETGNDAD